MKELKNKKIFFIIILLLTIATIYWCYTEFGYKEFVAGYITGENGLNLFYRLSGFNLFLPFYLLLAFLTNNIICDNFYKNKYSKFQNYITTRVGYNNRFKYEIKNVLVSSFIVRLCLHIFMLVIINTFFLPVGFTFLRDPSNYPSSFFAFSSNSFISFIFFIIYSCIGFSILSLFVYSLINKIKNLYLYKIIGILTSIICSMASALIGNLWLMTQNKINIFINIIIHLFYSGNLLSPGIEAFTSSNSIISHHLYYYVSCIGFLIISYLFLLQKKKEKHYG